MDNAVAVPLWRKIWQFPLVAMIVALALVIATMTGISWALSGLKTPANPELASTVKSIAAVLAVFALYKLVLRRLGSRKHDDLPLAPALKQWGAGVGLGFGIMTVVVGIAALAGVYHIDGWGGGEDAVMVLVSAGLVAGFIEEVLFRGILFRWIEEMLGSWAALAITSLLFGMAHFGNDSATLFSSVAIALEAGILLGAAYMLTRSLWLAVGVHMGWNVTQGLIFDVPVSGHPVRGLVEARLTGHELLSGGAFGLEASIIGLVIATGAGLWLLRKAIRLGRVMPPMWLRKG